MDTKSFAKYAIGTIVVVALIAFMPRILDALRGKHPAVGAWDLMVEMPGGPTPHMLIVEKDMSGVIIATEPVEVRFPFSGAEVDGLSISFEFSGEIEGQRFTSKVEATVDDDDEISGRYLTEFGNAWFTGTRF